MDWYYFLLAYVVAVFLSRWLNLTYNNLRYSDGSDVWFIGWVIPVWNLLIIAFYTLGFIGYGLSHWAWWKGENF